MPQTGCRRGQQRRNTTFAAQRACRAPPASSPGLAGSESQTCWFFQALRIAYLPYDGTLRPPREDLRWCLNVACTNQSWASHPMPPVAPTAALAAVLRLPSSKRDGDCGHENLLRPPQVRHCFGSLQRKMECAVEADARLPESVQPDE